MRNAAERVLVLDCFAVARDDGKANEVWRESERG